MDDLIASMQIFFGPSRQFSKIFKNMILFCNSYTYGKLKDGKE